jgi:anti-sigma-K factor RskA
MTADALDDLLPAHALGALDGDDCATLDRALASGGDLARRGASWTWEMEALATVVEPVAPSQILRTRLLQSVAREAAAAEAPSVRALSPAAAAAARAPWFLGAAAAGLLLLALWGQVDRVGLRTELASLHAADRDLAARLAAVNEQLGAAHVELARLRTESRIVSAPDMHPVVLAGLDSAPRSTAHTFVSPRDGKALFYAYGLPALPAGKQYQLWFIAGGKPVSGGVFDVDGAGNGTLLVDRVAPVESIQAWAVTLEPAGGLPAPSGAMVLKG